MNTRAPIPQAEGAYRLPTDPPTPHQNLFGLSANTLRVRTIPLTNARTEIEFPGNIGNFLWVLDATSLTANLTLKFEFDQGAGFEISKGFFLAGIQFNKFVITNNAQANESVTFLFGRAANPPLSVVNPSADLATVTLSKPTAIDTVADVSLLAGATTQILAADTDRREAIITNLAANSQTFRIGDSNAAAARGTPLAPGETIILEGTEAIHGHNPGAGAESVAVTTVKD